MSTFFLTLLNKNHLSLYMGLLESLGPDFTRVCLVCRNDIYEIIKGDILIQNNNTRIDLVSGKRSDVIIRSIKNACTGDTVILDEYYNSYKDIGRVKKSKGVKILYIVHNGNRIVNFRSNKMSQKIEQLVYAKKIHNQFDAYITMSLLTKEYLESFLAKNIFYFPFRKDFEQKVIKKENHNDIEILIPGMIDDNRRDYINVFNAFQEYFKRHPESAIKIRCLGRLKDERLVPLIESLNKETERVLYYDKYIEDGEYNERIKQADIILSNSRFTEIKSKSIEVYGLTKESGASFIINSFAKPGIFPRSQLTFTDLESQLLRYDSNDSLIGILERIEKDKEMINELQINAFRNRQKSAEIFEAELQIIKKWQGAS